MYYFPNRPMLISPESPMVEAYSQDKLWIAEIKKNGDRLCLFKENNKFVFMNRHKQELKYKPIDSIVEQLNSMDIPNGTQLDGELIHNHTKNVKHKIYLYDIYQIGGMRVSSVFQERRKILEALIKCNQNIELATQYKDDFVNLFKEVTKKEENEGLVMKKLDSMLSFNAIKSPDVYWQVKIRKPSKCYNF